MNLQFEGELFGAAASFDEIFEQVDGNIEWIPVFTETGELAGIMTIDDLFDIVCHTAR